MTKIEEISPDGQSAIQQYGGKFVRNISHGVVSMAANTVVQLIFLGYLVGRLGPERFGLVVIGLTVASSLCFFQLGSATAIGKKLNDSTMAGDEALFGRYFSAGIIIALVVAVPMLGALGVLLTVFWPMLNIPGEFATEGIVVVGMIGLTAVAMPLSLPWNACLHATHRLDIYYKLITASLIVRVVPTVLVFELWRPSTIAYAAALLLGAAAQLLLLRLWVRSFVPAARFHRKRVDWPTLKGLTTFSLLSLFDAMARVTFLQLPLLVITRYGGLGAAGLYGLAVQLIVFLFGFVAIGINSATPVAVSLKAQRKPESFQRLFYALAKLWLAFGLAIWCGVVFLGGPFFRLWLPTRNVEPLVAALPWIFGACAVGIVGQTNRPFLIALEKLHVLVLAGIVLASAMLGAMVWVCEIGVEPLLVYCGAMILVAYGLYQGVGLTILGRNLPIQPARYLRQVIVPAALPVAALAAALYGLSRLWQVSSWLELAFSAGVAAGVFALIGYCWMLNVEDRQRIRRMLSRSPQQEGAAAGGEATGDEQGSCHGLPGAADANSHGSPGGSDR